MEEACARFILCKEQNKMLAFCFALYTDKILRCRRIAGDSSATKYWPRLTLLIKLRFYRQRNCTILFRAVAHAQQDDTCFNRKNYPNTVVASPEIGDKCE